MTEIHDLLERAVDHPGPVDVAPDLRRARAALRRRRTRIAGSVVCGVALLGAFGVSSVVQHAAHDRAVPPAVDPSGPLVRTPYFEVPQPPDGWQVESSAHRTAFVTLSHDGAGDHGPGPAIDHWDGKVVVMLHEARGPSFGFGSSSVYDGRTFYDNESNAGTSILAVRLADGRWLQLQYPTSAGFDSGQMVAYLDAVVVRPGAVGFGN